MLDIRVERIGLAMGPADSNIPVSTLMISMATCQERQHAQDFKCIFNARHENSFASSIPCLSEVTNLNGTAKVKPEASIWTAGIRAISDSLGRRVNDPACMWIDL